MLAEAHRHINDDRIKFDETRHQYFIDSKKIRFSVTGLIEEFFPKFDSEYWGLKKAKEQLESEDKSYDENELIALKNKIINEWSIKGKTAADKGTILHEKIEDFYNSKFYDDYPPEFEYFKNFHNKYKRLKPYRTEWRVFDKDISIAGTIDMVYKKENGQLFIFDWKRSTGIVDNQGKLILKDFNFGFSDLSHLADNSFNKYALQQNVYKHILENNYGKTISSMNLLVLHPDYDNYFHVKLPNLQKEAEFLINKAKELSK